VKNAGDMNLVVQDVTVKNDTVFPNCNFSSDWGGTATTLIPNGSVSIEVRYTGSGACLDGANEAFDTNVLHIRSNDPVEPDYVVRLNGVSVF
jgi:hypothetical protein